MNSTERIRDYMGRHGVKYTLRRLWQKGAQRYLGTYDRRREKDLCPPEELERQRANPPEAGLISVVIPVYNTDPGMLGELIECLKGQTYPEFEAILYDGRSTKEETREALRALEAGGDARFRVVWGKENKGISGNTNEAAALARGEYVALADHDDLVTPDALWRAAERIAAERPDLIYSDEDRVAENGRSHMDPHYKPEWCPDNLNSDNYICHLAVIRKEILEAVGGLRSGFDGSQDHDLMLRIAEKTQKIRHLPYTLYSWRENRSSMSHTDLNRCLESGCRAAAEHEAKLGRKVTAKPVNKAIRLWYEIPEDAEIDAVIHGGTEAEREACFRELREKTGWKKLGMRAAAGTGSERIRAINRAAAESAAEYLLILDARARDVNTDFIRELLMYAQREDAAGVTPVLTDRRGRITHGGFALGVEGAAQCVNEGLAAGAGGWHDTMNKVHNVSAVSLGCFLVRRENWIELDEGYRGGFAAVDMGMRQREKGKLFVVTPHARAVMERCGTLLSYRDRNGEEIREDRKRFAEKWGEEIEDPCYSRRFRRERANYRF